MEAKILKNLLIFFAKGIAIYIFVCYYSIIKEQNYETFNAYTKFQI